MWIYPWTIVMLIVIDLGFVSQYMFCLLFADDTTLPFSDKNISRVKLKLNTILNDVIRWQTNCQ